MNVTPSIDIKTIVSKKNSTNKVTKVNKEKTEPKTEPKTEQ